MRREQLEHVLRAASQIADDSDVLVIGSQSVLGAIPEDRLPSAATASIEVDVAFFDDPDDRKADRVDGAIGELSPFHETFGYYAQGVSLSTAVLPECEVRLDPAPGRVIRHWCDVEGPRVADDHLPVARANDAGRATRAESVRRRSWPMHPGGARDP